MSDSFVDEGEIEVEIEELNLDALDPRELERRLEIGGIATNVPATAGPKCDFHIWG